MINFLRIASIVLLVIVGIAVIIGAVAIGDISAVLYLAICGFALVFYAGFIFVFLQMAEEVQYIKGKIWMLETKKTDNANNDKGFSILSYGKSENANKNQWKCPDCGRVNQNYTGTCACGKTK